MIFNEDLYQIMKKKIAFITGINGQDGSYLANYLLKKKYIVYGLSRRTSNYKFQRLKYLKSFLNF